MSDSWTPRRTKTLDHAIRQLHEAVRNLEDEFSEDGRKFTIDGHLLGSIGEVVAAYAFNLKLLPPSSKDHDAETRDGNRKVQIKLTGGRRGIALYSKPEHLLVLQLADDEFKLVYNGPGKPVWEYFRKNDTKQRKNGQYWVGLSTLRRLNEKAAPRTKLQQPNVFPKPSKQ